MKNVIVLFLNILLLLDVGYAANLGNGDGEGGVPSFAGSRAGLAFPVREKLEAGVDAINKIEAITTARKRYNEMLLAFMSREDINPEDKLQAYYTALGVDFEEGRRIGGETDEAQKHIKGDLNVYESFQRKIVTTQVGKEKSV